MTKWLCTYLDTVYCQVCGQRIKTGEWMTAASNDGPWRHFRCEPPVSNEPTDA